MTGDLFSADHATAVGHKKPEKKLGDLINQLKSHQYFGENIVHVHEHEPAPPRHQAWPNALHENVVKAYQSRGIAEPYSHQAEAIESAVSGRHTILVTPTASGKTLCYNAPVLDAIVKDPNARALYFYPTKALSHDQYHELYSLSQQTGEEIRVFTYDGDTPPETRRALRDNGQIIMTNPDMLHSGILPHHTKWLKLFENLKYIVIDELHHYRGIFGSHLAHVLFRLRRLCEFYGANPTFICCSATISNPKELARELTGHDFNIVDQSGAPTGKRVFMFYNPPVVNQELNVRKSVRIEATRLAARFITRGHQAIIFGHSRIQIEVMTTYLKRLQMRLKRDPDKICGYRSGYLPRERRAIERGVKNGDILGVVSTNALELGIDIGGLDVSIMAGYPGSIASAWQQAGRAGRKGTDSLVIFIGSNSPIDQYLMQHPEFFFGRSPEEALINPNNLIVTASHLKCGTFEMPMKDKEKWLKIDPTSILRVLEEQRVLRYSGNRWFYSTDSFPAENVSLRSGVDQNFLILERGNRNQILGEVEYNAAPFLLHDHAIYLHNAKTYYVEKLEWDRRTAYVRKRDVDYYTDAESSSDVQILNIDQVNEVEHPQNILDQKGFGNVLVSTVITKFKKVKFETQESIGAGPVNVPPLEIQTEAMWICFDNDLPKSFEEGRSGFAAALQGIANLLRILLPIRLMCERRDIGVLAQLKGPHQGLPMIIVWDKHPGGIGLARRFYAKENEILQEALNQVRECTCEEGCPACTGPKLETGHRGKELTAKLLAGILKENTC